MPKKKDAHDSLLPLIQSLDALWSDYLSPLLDSGASGRNAQWVYQRVTEAEVPASLAVTVVHRVHLAEPFNNAIDASLVFYDLGEDPLNPHATQHVVCPAPLN